MTNEHRKAISLSLIGKKRNPEVCKAIGLGHKGKTLSLEHRKKIGLSQLGKKRKSMSREVIERIRILNTKYPGNNKFDRKLRRAFGITEIEYNEILKRQNGHCATCPRTPEDEGRRLAVDHDHKTGKVRGLLCYPCNISLGIYEKNKEAFDTYLSPDYKQGWSRKAELVGATQSNIEESVGGLP